ncbi:MAG: hypothetical protein R2710_16970 [Acidimicrobiales bacterium]
MTEHTPEAERHARKLANTESMAAADLAAAAAAVAAVGVLSTLNNPSAYASVIEATEVVARPTAAAFGSMSMCERTRAAGRPSRVRSSST